MRAIAMTASALALVCGGSAAAASYTDTHVLTGLVNQSTDPNLPTYYSESYSWAGFNTALGTLTAVNLNVASTVQLSETYRAYAGQTVNYAATEIVSLYINGISPGFSGTSTGTLTLSPAGVANFAATASGSQTYTAASDLLRFTTSPLCCNLYLGLPNVMFGGTTVFPDRAGTILSQHTDVAITYVYTAVPEPAGWATMLAGFAGAAAVLRRRRNRSTALA